MVDSELGFPPGYGKLCKQACIREARFRDDEDDDGDEAEMYHFKEFASLFAHVDDVEKDSLNARKHAEFLWQELDHLGNAGFDPVKFRVDVYGNVVYWNADSGSPLAWEVDHWFPYSRGGKTIVSNLRIVQWQAHERKGTDLEFLVPRCDLQVGISVSQFLSVFLSRNADFRKRSFSLFFQDGENEHFVNEHSWPQDFYERKNQVGLASAAIVKVHKPLDDTLRVINHNKATKQVAQSFSTGATPARRRWTSDEEEALRKAVQKFGPGNWKDIKEFEPKLVNRSTVQIKDKYRLMKGEWQLDKENKEVATDRFLSAAITLQKEERINQTQEKEKKQKEEELALLVDQVKRLSVENEKERCLLEELEKTLANEKNRSEKERKWAETQAEYKLCLERMIQDTMHQCDAYKEETKLNHAACNALRARLETRKATCDVAEIEFVKVVKERESLEYLTRPEIIKNTVNEAHIDMEISMTCISSKEVNHKTGRTGEGDELFHKDKHQDFSDSLEETITTKESLCNIPNLSKQEEIPASSEEEYESPEEFLHAQEEALVSARLPMRIDMAVIQTFDNAQCIRETLSNGRDKKVSGLEMQTDINSSTTSTRSSEMKRIVLESGAMEVEEIEYNGQPDDSQWDQEVFGMGRMVRTTLVDNIVGGKGENDEASPKKGQENPITVTRANVAIHVLHLDHATEGKSNVSDNIVDNEYPRELAKDPTTETRETVETHVQHPFHDVGSNVSEAEEVTSGYSMPEGFVKKLKPKQEKGEAGKVYTVDVIEEDNETDVNIRSHVQNKAHFTDVAESNISGSEKITTSNSMFGGFLKKLNPKHNKIEEEEDSTSLFKFKKGNVEKPHDQSHEKHSSSPWRCKASSGLSLKRFASVNGTSGLFLRQKSRGSPGTKDGKVEEISFASKFSGKKQDNEGHEQDVGKRTGKAFSEMGVIPSTRCGRERELTLKLPKKSEEILPTLRDILDDSCLSSSSLQAPVDCKGSPSSEVSSIHCRLGLQEESCSSSSSQSSVDYNVSLPLKEASSFSQGPMDCNQSSSSSSSSSSASPQFGAQLEISRVSSSSSSLSESPQAEAQVESGRASASSSAPLPFASPSKTLQGQLESSGEGQEKPKQQEKNLWLSLLKARIDVMGRSRHSTMAETHQKHEEEAYIMLAQSRASHQENLNRVIAKVEKEDEEGRDRGGEEEEDERTSRQIVKDEEEEQGTREAENVVAMAPLKKQWDATLSHVWRKAVKKFELAARNP